MLIVQNVINKGNPYSLNGYNSFNPMQSQPNSFNPMQSQQPNSQQPNLFNPTQSQQHNSFNPMQSQPNSFNPMQSQQPNSSNPMPNSFNPMQSQQPNSFNPMQSQQPNSFNPMQSQQPNSSNPMPNSFNPMQSQNSSSEPIIDKTKNNEYRISTNEITLFLNDKTYVTKLSIGNTNIDFPTINGLSSTFYGSNCSDMSNGFATHISSTGEFKTFIFKNPHNNKTYAIVCRKINDTNNPQYALSFIHNITDNKTIKIKTTDQCTVFVYKAEDNTINSYLIPNIRSSSNQPTKLFQIDEPRTLEKNANLSVPGFVIRNNNENQMQGNELIMTDTRNPQEEQYSICSHQQRCLEIKDHTNNTNAYVYI